MVFYVQRRMETSVTNLFKIGLLGWGASIAVSLLVGFIIHQITGRRTRQSNIADAKNNTVGGDMIKRDK